MQNPFLDKAFQWVEHPSGEDMLSEQEHCPTRDIFLARLEKAHFNPLFLAVLGEIGNNAFDHNLGNWRHIPGIYFVVDKEKNTAVIADRGQGVRKTLGMVDSSITSDVQALEIAFTKQISGRAPERRGNGLKFVREVVQKQKWNLEFYSGTGKAIIKQDKGLGFSQEDRNVQGCIVFISI